MKQIPLTQGKIALVNDEDYEFLNGFHWRAKKEFNSYYCYTRIGHGVKNRKHISMHRLILQAKPGEVCDHIDGNGLNNCRSNIRITTARGNGQNLHIPKTSKYPGVRIDKLGKKWQAQIKINGKQRHLGTFDNEIDAATAYRVACAVLVGE